MTFSKPLLDIARDLVERVASRHIAGANLTVAASSTEKVAVDGVMGLPIIADAMRIKAGGNAADDAAGAGAITVVIEGVNILGVEVTDTLLTNGVDVGVAGTVEMFRVTKAFVADVGTYGVENTGDIVIEDEAGVQDMIVIAAGKGESQSSLSFIPLAKTGWITRVSVSAEAAKAADLELYQRRDALDVSTPFTSPRLIANAGKLLTSLNVPIDAYIEVPALTDIYAEATTASGAVADVGASYDLMIVDD